MAFLTEAQLSSSGFKKLGANVQISEKASIYGAGEICIGDNVRIDDFAILSAGEGGIVIGQYVHIACYSAAIGHARIEFRDYSGISSRVTVYSSSDSYDGQYMTNPCLPQHVLNTYHEEVVIGRHVVVGASSVILPGVALEDGCAVGAMSLVTKSFPAGSIVVGVPARKIKERKQNIFQLEKQI